MSDNMKSLYQYEKEQDAHVAREEAISDLSVHIGLVIKAGNMYYPGEVYYHHKPYWSMEDFNADREINEKYTEEALNGEPKNYLDQMEDQFEKFCEDIAEQCIDEVNRLNQGE